jgi:hypothetical protein
MIIINGYVTLRWIVKKLHTSLTLNTQKKASKKWKQRNFEISGLYSIYVP